MFLSLFSAFVIMHSGFGGAPTQFPGGAPFLGPGGQPFPGSTEAPACDTVSRYILVDHLSKQLLVELNRSGLMMSNFTTTEASVLDVNLPVLFEYLCDTTESGTARQQLLFETHACPDLKLSGVPVLRKFYINGHSLGNLLTSLGGFTSFCDCRYRLLNAWSYNDRWWDHVYTFDRHTRFVITHIGNICGKTLGRLTDSIDKAPSECRPGLESQAGFPNSMHKTFNDLLDIVKTCESSSDIESDWACIKRVASSMALNKCILKVETTYGRNGTKAMCGRYQCVVNEMNQCGSTAIKLYLKAIDMEMYRDELDRQLGFSESYDGCDGGSGLHFSVLLLTVASILSITQTRP